MSDATNAVAAGVIAASISHPYPDFSVLSAEQRALNIQDNFGVRTQSLREFNKQRGSHGRWLPLGAAAAGAALGGLLALALASTLPVTATVAFISFTIAGIFTGVAIQSSQHKSLMQDYGNYLDSIATQGREMRVKAAALAPAAEYDNASGRTQTFQADLDAQREKTFQQAALRS